MKYIILLLTSLFSLQLYAADEGDWWLQRNVTTGDGLNEHRRVNVTSSRAYDAPITKDGITKMERLFKNVVVEDVPSKQKLGKVLLERGKAFKGGLAGVLGGAAITGMIQAVGWVMEQGTWVKYKDNKEDESCKYLSYLVSFGRQYATCGLENAFQNVIHLIQADSPQYTNIKLQSCTRTQSTDPSLSTYATGTCTISRVKKTTGESSTNTYSVNSTINPNQQTPQPQKIIITDQDVGGIATGDYTDPVDPKFNITDKKYNPVVPTAYQHDPTGIGEDIANEIDDRIKNAPPTSDGKPAPVGDPRYSQPPQEDKTTNDRSWDDESDSTGEGSSKPEIDPETGQATGGQTFTFKFPPFCEWAYKVCDWYDDWKKSDKVYKDHMTKTEEHQTQEKTFWQSVKDWFDWTKEPLDEEPDSEEEETDTQGIFERTFDTSFSLSNECPPDIPFSLETYFFSGSWNISTSWLCIIFTFLGYPLVFLSHCCGLWILYETVVHRQIKW